MFYYNLVNEDISKFTHCALIPVAYVSSVDIHFLSFLNKDSMCLPRIFDAI